MAKARLLQAVCTVAMLAAAPAFAQTDTQPESTGTGNTVNAPVADNMSGATGSATQSSKMSPASKMGSSSGSAMNGQSTHRSAMAGHSGMMRGKNDSSQDAAVDQLNEQSYRAAQQGQAFSASNMGSGGMTAPGGSGSMNGMSGGSTSGTMGTGGTPGEGTGK